MDSKIERYAKKYREREREWDVASHQCRKDC